MTAAARTASRTAAPPWPSTRCAEAEPAKPQASQTGAQNGSTMPRRIPCKSSHASEMLSVAQTLMSASAETHLGAPRRLMPLPKRVETRLRTPDVATQFLPGGENGLSHPLQARQHFN